MYCLHGTVAWKVKPCSVWLLLLSQSSGSPPGKEVDWEEVPVHKQRSSLPIKLTNSDRQLTHSSKQRPTSGPRLWQEAAHPPVCAGNVFYISVANSTSRLEIILFDESISTGFGRAYLEIYINQLKKQKRNVTQYFGSYLIRGIQCWTIYMHRSYIISPLDGLKSPGHFT